MKRIMRITLICMIGLLCRLSYADNKVVHVYWAPGSYANMFALTKSLSECYAQSSKATGIPDTITNYLGSVFKYYWTSGPSLVGSTYYPDNTPGDFTGWSSQVLKAAGSFKATIAPFETVYKWSGNYSLDSTVVTSHGIVHATQDMGAFPFSCVEYTVYVPTTTPPPPPPPTKKHLGTGCDGSTTTKGDPGTSCGEPINQSTGNVMETQIDYRSAGAFPLTVVRYYNSQSTDSGVFGANWTSMFEANLKQISTTTVLVTRPDGRGLTFTQTNGAWVADGDVNDRLVQTSKGWTYTANDNTIEIYDAAGKLTSMTQQGGLTETFAYNSAGQIASVTGPFGRMLHMTENANGQIASITDPSGAVYKYAYDANHNLTSVTYPDGNSRQYLYENSAFPHALTGLVDENGVQFTSWTYDSAGRGTSSVHANNTDLTGVQYRLDSNNAITSSTVTDPLSAVHTYTYQVINSSSHTVKETQSAATGSGTASRTWQYDADGNAISSTDFRGNTTNATYDSSRNLPLTQTDATGRTITTQWDANFRLPDRVTVKDTAGQSRSTTFTYDSVGHVQTKTLSDPTTGASRTWTYTYNVQGLLASVNGPRTDVNDVTTYTYDAQGNLANVINALGQTTRLTAYDADGRPLSFTDANGRVTQLSYDERGRLLSQSVGGEVTTYQYDHAGLLTNVTRPDGSMLTYIHDDAHRQTEVDDSLGNRLVYNLDAAGNHTQVQSYDPNGTLQSTRQQVFDQLSHLVQVIGAKSQTTDYQYDDNGNLVGVTDALGHPTTDTYDAVNRLIQQVDANGGETRTTYDAFNDIISVTDPDGHVTTYTYDNLGDKLSQTSPDTGTTTYTYDSAGNVTSMTDARGDTTTYTYDALNRVTNATYADGMQTTNQYDQGGNGIGHLTQVTDSSGTTSWTYDQYGHVLTKTQQTGSVTLTTSMTYNAAGQLTSLTYPSGDTVGYTYNQGLVSSLTLNDQPLLANISYQAFGPVNGWTWRNGKAYTRDYNTDSQLVSYALPGETRTLSYDKVGNITSITRPTRSETLGYDALNRLIAANDANFNLGYNYDANGNRLSLSDGASTTTYTYASDSNQLLSLSGATNQTNQYDADGNLIDDVTHSYLYDARNHLVSVDEGNTATYVYNALGQRVQKTALQPGNAIGAAKLSSQANPQAQASQSAAAQHVATVQANVQTVQSSQAQANSGSAAQVGGMITTLFAYDENGNLLGEYDSAGNVGKEIIRLGRLPVAVVQNGQVYDIYTDQRGAPRAIADNSGTVVWSWDPSPFGNTEANNNPDGNNIKFTFNIRFPGQYYDVETGRYYNHFRYYDPSTGRYITSDPIGLRGGLNTYGYVNANPMLLSDPTGQGPFLDWLIEKSAQKAAKLAAKHNVKTDTQKIIIDKLKQDYNKNVAGGMDPKKAKEILDTQTNRLMHRTMKNEWKSFKQNTWPTIKHQVTGKPKPGALECP